MDSTNHEEDAIINQAAAMEMANAISGTSTVPAIDIVADEPEIAADDKADGEPAGPTIDERIATIVEENRQLRKGLESMNGTYGSELQALRSKIGSIPSSNNNDLSASLAGLSIDNPAFADLRENYPELGGLILNGIKTALTVNPESRQQDAAKVQEEVTAKQDVEINNRIEQITQDQNQLALDIAIDKFNEEHPDKKDLEFEVQELAKGATKIKWKNQAFGDWVESQPEDARELLINGGKTPAEVRGISQLLAEFKKSKAPEQARPKRDQIKPDLSRSILPNGRMQQGSVKMTEDEIIAAAAIEEMKRNM